MSVATIMVLALLLDAMIGDPDRIWRRAPHPAALMGRAIGVADRLLNTASARRAKGALAILGLAAGAALLGWAIASIPDGGVLELVLATILLAQKSLVDHVGAVARALEHDLERGRRTIARIVGRDPKSLNEADIIRAAIESIAENFSDGVVAPVFWYLLFGLPGLMAYKMVNTADSMVGYRNARYRDFGWGAARLDDLMNWIPARLAGLLICATHASRAAFALMRRDAPLHRSPNAGWPEAATAGVLGVAISGPRVYDGRVTADPFVNPEGRYDVIAADIDNAVRVIWRGWAGLLASVAVIWLIGG